jgi:hypothetical protein
VRRLYISAFEVLSDLESEYVPVYPDATPLFDSRHSPSPSKALALPRAGVALLRSLHGEGIPFTLFSDFWDYAAIAQEVATSCALLAIVDKYYMSSTGKMIESGYARGRMPILVLPVERDAALRFITMLGPAGITMLSGSTEAAGQQVSSMYHGAG